MAGSSSGGIESSRLIHPCYVVEYGLKSQMYPKSVEFVIGRAKFSDFHISSVIVSRKHCEINCTEYGWRLHNLSTVGTWLNGKIVSHHESVPLRDTDVMRLGDVYIQCFLRIDVERCHLPLHVLRFEVLLGQEYCSLNAGFLQKTGPQSAIYIDINEEMLLSEHAILKDINEIDINPSEANLTDKSAIEIPTKKDIQAKNVVQTKEKILVEQLALDRVNKLKFMKQLDESNKAVMDAMSAKKEADLEIARLKQELANQSSSESVKLGILSKIEELIETELQCSVCNELLICATTLNCSHTFCEYCLMEWKKKNNICPICRSTINSESKTRVIDSFIEKIILNLSDDIQERRRELIDSRKVLKPPVVEKRKSRKRRRTNISASNNGRQAITIALHNLANLMDTTIDISSDEESPVFLLQRSLSQ